MKKKTCFYCGAALVSGSYQLDHFPIPERNGGKHTVPACLSCHDMKDRLRFNQWPEELVHAILADFPYLNRETRIFIAKSLSIASDLIEKRKRGGTTD